MNVISEITQLRTQVRLWREQQNSVALVPTMGHLHAGHLSLIEIAQSKVQRVVVTIFVNPLQFNQSEDFTQYPRTLATDLEKLQKMDVAVVFTPSDQELYPNGTDYVPRILIPQLSEEFCGKYRPGHFAGVCTIVSKLFNIVTPDYALFGSKDYQQLLIIKRLVQELNFNVEIIAAGTIREDDGLAMSSRNSLLNPQQRALAPKLYQTLQDIRQQFSFERINSLQQSALTELDELGFASEYLAIRDASNLRPVDQNTENIVVLVAAWLGSTRLIDNVLFPRP